MVLVTGSTGFLGNYLVQALSAASTEPILALYNSTLPKQQFPNVTYIQANLLDVDAVWQITKGVHKIYHCANQVSFDNGDVDSLYKNNVEGTANLVNAAIENGIEKFLHVSSVGAIGRQGEGILITEETPWITTPHTSNYALSKYQSEMEVWRGHAEGLNMVIVNPSIILGAGDLSRSSVQLFKNVLNEFPFYTGGTNGFVAVHDLVNAMIALMNSNIANERFIINQDNYSYKDILTKMAKAMGKKAPTKLATPFMSKLAVIYFSLRKMFTGKKALITKETAGTANAVYIYDNSKLLAALPDFRYTDMDSSLARIAQEFKAYGFQ
jgi:dihydroflavonol-4-reductase